MPTDLAEPRVLTPGPTAGLTPASAAPGRPRLILFCAAAYAFLAAETVLSHLAVPTALGWKLIPIGYCLWVAAMLLVAANVDLSPPPRRVLLILVLLGVPLGVLGLWLHLHGTLLGGLIRSHALPVTTTPMPLALAYVSLLTACSIRFGPDRLMGLLVAAGLAGLAAAAYVDHAAAGFRAPALTFAAAVVLPTVGAVLVAIQALQRRPLPLLRRMVHITCLLLILTGLAGAMVHWAWPNGAGSVAQLWLVPQEPPLAAPLALATLGVLAAIAMISPLHPPANLTLDSQRGLPDHLYQ